MNPEDPMAELEQVCEYALQEAPYRPLYDDEIRALRFAAALYPRSRETRQLELNYAQS